MSQLPVFKELYGWSLDAIYVNLNGLRISQAGPDAFCSLGVVDPEIVKHNIGQDGTVYVGKSNDKRVLVSLTVMQNSRDAGRIMGLIEAQRNAPAAAGILRTACVVKHLQSGSGVQGAGPWVTMPDELGMNAEAGAIVFGLLLPYGLDTLRISPLAL